jgi:hypothetical protein
MSDRIRPSVLRNLPALVFCLGAGLFGILVDNVPVIVMVFGAIFLAAFVLYAALLLTTWLEFGEEVRVSTWGRKMAFRAGESTLRLKPLPVGFFGETTAIELRSADGRFALSLAIFRPGDQERIKRELRRRFKADTSS